MKIRININEIGLEKSSKPLNEIIGIVGKPYTAARSAARLRRLKRIYDGPIEPARVDDFLAFTKGRKVRLRPGPAIENIMKRVSDSKREEILRALQDTAETGSSHVVKVGENPDLFIATARTEEGPRIVGRAVGDGGDVKLASEIDSTFGSARFIENPIAINDLPSATLVSRGGPLDVDDYDILASRFEQLKNDDVLTDADYDDLVRRIEVRRDAPRRTLSVAEVADLDNVDDLEEFRNTIDQRLEAGVYTIDDVEEVRRAIDDKIPELNLSAAEAEAFLTAQKARDQLADAGVEVDKIAQLQTPEEVGEAINALNLVRDDLPPDEVANLEALLNSRRSQVDDLARAGDDAAEAGDDAAEAGDDAVEAGDDAVEAGDDMPTTVPYVEETIEDWPVRRYETREAAEEAAKEFVEESDIAFGIQWNSILREMGRIGKKFKLVPENAPIFKDGNREFVYVLTQGGKAEPISIEAARKLIEELKETSSAFKRSFAGASNPSAYLDDLQEFAVVMKGDGWSKKYKALAWVLNSLIAPGNTFISPAITAVLRKRGFSTGTIIMTKDVLFHTYLTFAVVTTFAALKAAYDEAKLKAKTMGKQLDFKQAMAKAIVDVSTDSNIAPYMAILDQEWVDSLREDAKISSKQMKVIEKIAVEKSKIMKGIKFLKDGWDAAPKLGFALVGEAGSGISLGSLFTTTTTSPEDIAPELAATAAEEKEITAATGVAKEKMDQLQYEFGSTVKSTWPGASEEASPSDPKHASRKAVVNDYFTVFKDLEWPKMNDAEKVGHEKLIDMYIDWAETIGDTALLGKAGRLKKEIPVVETKQESIIALPTLGNLRIRIKK
jgi:hypothetical protein